MSECVFCEVVQGRSPVSAFYEDDVVIGLLTIEPVTTGHALIIPKRHCTDLSGMDEETGRHLWTVTQRTAAAIRASGIRCEGISLSLADGEAAGQDVFHVHFHVFPRYKGDPFKLAVDWNIRPPREELDAVARQIQGAYVQMWSKETYAGRKEDET